MTSHQLADQLATLAEHLKQQPDLDIGTIHLLNGYGPSAEQFKALAKVFPKPMTKRIRESCGDKDIVLENVSGDSIMRISLSVNQDKVCRLVRAAQPAVYDCEPILSHAEEEELTR